MDKNKKQALYQNLADAGCNKFITEEFFLLYEQGAFSEALRLLGKHKTELLEDLHNSQNKIDCLDYLIFDLKQKKEI